MNDKITYAFLGTIIVISSILVLFFTLIGIDAVFKMNTVYGYIFMVLCGVAITLCSCYAVINLKPKGD
jgi:hypothetical protein